MAYSGEPASAGKGEPGNNEMIFAPCLALRARGSCKNTSLFAVQSWRRQTSGHEETPGTPSGQTNRHATAAVRRSRPEHPGHAGTPQGGPFRPNPVLPAEARRCHSLNLARSAEAAA